MFAKAVFPDSESYISDPFSSQDIEEKIWTYLNQNQFETAMHFKETLTYGNREKNIPPDSEYRIGRQIMENFVEHNPGITVEQWTTMPDKEIMEKSRYEEKFQ